MELDARSLFRRRRKDLPSPYFPATQAKRALRQTAELKKWQQTRRVSLALPMIGGPVSPWMREWSSIAMDFDCQAYDPMNNYGEIKMLP